MSAIRKTTLHRFFNENDIPQFGCGRRSVVALPPGRKWITLVDWTTLDVAKVEIALWQRMKPEAIEIRAAPVERAIRSRINLFETCAEAEAQFGGKPAKKYTPPVAVKEVLKLLKN